MRVSEEIEVEVCDEDGEEQKRHNGTGSFHEAVQGGREATLDRKSGGEYAPGLRRSQGDTREDDPHSRL